MVGGYGSDGFNSVEVIGDKKCAVPQLPSTNNGNQVILTNNNEILTCGGYGNNLQKCFVLNTKKAKWEAHSDLINERFRFDSVTMPTGVYLFGGYSSRTTSEFLPSGSTNWQMGPSVGPMGPILYGCAVRKSDFEIIFIGGEYSDKKIIQLNIKTNKWTTLGELQEGRYHHACAVFDDKIVVTGGYNSKGGWTISSSEVISLQNLSKSELVGHMNERRSEHGMAIAQVNGKPTLLAFGGENGHDFVDSIEQWIPESQSWAVLSDSKLSEAKRYFGHLSIPTQLICP